MHISQHFTSHLSSVHSLDLVLVFRLPVLCHHSSVGLFLQTVSPHSLMRLKISCTDWISSVLTLTPQQKECVCSCSGRPSADVHIGQCCHYRTPPPASLPAVYNVRRNYNVQITGWLVLIGWDQHSRVSCRTSENYVLYYYVKPYTRYGPFLIGILTGIYLSTKKDQLLKHKVRRRVHFDRSSANIRLTEVL